MLGPATSSDFAASPAWSPGWASGTTGWGKRDSVLAPAPDASDRYIALDADPAGTDVSPAPEAATPAAAADAAAGRAHGEVEAAAGLVGAAGEACESTSAAAVPAGA